MSDKPGMSGASMAVLAIVSVVAIAGLGSWLSGAFSPLVEEPRTPVAQPGTGGNTSEPADATAEAPATETPAEKAPATSAAEAQAEVSEAEPAGTDTAGGETTGAAPAETAAAPEPVAAADGADTAAQTGEPASDPVTPSFDLVRVAPNGMATVAGRARPGSEVVIEIDGAEAARVRAQADGSFAHLFDMPPSDAPRAVRLRADDAAGDPLYSRQTALVAPTAAKPAAPAPTDPAPSEPAATEPAVSDPMAAIASEEGSDSAAASEPADTVTAPDAQDAPVTAAAIQAPQPTETAEPEPAEPTTTQRAANTAPAVLMTDGASVRMVQPSGPSPEVMSNVALDTISYSDEGEVELSGRGQGRGFVRVYLDNTPVTTSRIEPDGGWRTELPNVDTGIYTLRVDEVDDEGRVTSRVETPFKREEKALVQGDKPLTAITVQPGHTLWAIARDNYGEGLLYVRLFEANREQIRDPDLIYPGQVFDIPRD